MNKLSTLNTTEYQKLISKYSPDVITQAKSWVLHARQFAESVVKDKFSHLPASEQKDILNACWYCYLEGQMKEKQDWLDWCNSLPGMTFWTKCLDLVCRIWLRVKNSVKG